MDAAIMRVSSCNQSTQIPQEEKEVEEEEEEEESLPQLILPVLPDRLRERNSREKRVRKIEDGNGKKKVNRRGRD